MQPRAIGYVRVSTDEQAASGLGLAAQRERITDEAMRRGWILSSVMEDAGYSARDLRRPGIQRALDGLRGHQAEVLVVSRLDRLSRSLLDFAAMMERSRRKGWALVALDLGVDTTSPAGEAMANVMATFAQLERRLISQRTREALAIPRSEGVVLGRPSSLPTEVVERIPAGARRRVPLGRDRGRPRSGWRPHGAGWPAVARLDRAVGVARARRRRRRTA